MKPAQSFFELCSSGWFFEKIKYFTFLQKREVVKASFFFLKLFRATLPFRPENN
jgi:hypothetical protein